MPASLGRGLAALLAAWTISAGSARSQEAPPLPPARPSPSPSQTLHDRPPLPASASASPSSSPARAAGADACLAELKANSVEADAVAAPPASLPDCRIAAPVRLSSIRLADGAALDLPGRPILDCAFAITFSGFVRDLLAPLGAANLGAAVVALDTGPGYECRGRNRVAGAKTSAHGQGLAIDVMAIVLADRRRVSIARQANARETSFVRSMRRAACGWFTTVLGPGADAAHADHLHFDVLRHGASDNYRICE
jgi:hypothetical protein